jgi:hypothetical protein
MCVECSMENSTQCTVDAPICDPENFECVGCVTSSDCNDADEARCDTDTNECVGCEGMADCESIADLPACNSGTCVECTPESENTDCDGTSCNPATLTCTDTTLASRQTCETCLADSECIENHRCVAMTYKGVRHPDSNTGFCLKSSVLGGSCTNPYRIVISRTSLSGAPEDDYCGINEGLSICEAVRALLKDDPCDPANGNADCPQPSEHDDVGLCKELPGMVDTCTYQCSSIVECPSSPVPGSTCGSSGSGDDDYCGGG